MNPKYSTRHPVTLLPGVVYTNENGSEYKCISSSATCSVMISKAGWILQAYGTGMYADGTIDWDFSTGVGFVDKELFWKEEGGEEDDK